jgi:hypothetical protein
MPARNKNGACYLDISTITSYRGAQFGNFAKDNVVGRAKEQVELRSTSARRGDTGPAKGGTDALESIAGR